MTGCVFVALNYFSIFIENGKNLNILNKLKSEPFLNHFYDKYANLLACRSFKYYPFKQDKMNENIEHNQIYMKNTIYFQTLHDLSLENLGKIFSEWGDVLVMHFLLFHYKF